MKTLIRVSLETPASTGEAGYAVTLTWWEDGVEGSGGVPREVVERYEGLSEVRAVTLRDHYAERMTNRKRI